jgi:4-alpha-glucanotransferase
LAGVQSSYVGFDGSEHRVDPEVIVSVLQVLGYPLPGMEAAGDVLARERERRAATVLEPVVVHRLDDAEHVSVPVPAGSEPEHCWLALVLEDGTAIRQRVSELLQVGAGGTLRMHAPTPSGGPIPPGYHELVFEGPGAESRALFIAAPRCPSAERGWGLFAPLHGLRSDSDWGAGSFSDLERAARWVRSRDGTFLGTLPMYPVFLEAPADPSPYLPVTRLGVSEIFVDPTAAEELTSAPAAVEVLRSPEFRARVAAAHAATLVPYEELARLRRAVLEPLATALYGDDRRALLGDFAVEHPELLAYARFRATVERHGRDRRRWPAAALRDLGRLSLDDAAVRYHLCAQWLGLRQLGDAARDGLLYGDLPVGVHPQGFDPFFEPDAFAVEARVGAPPDPFYADGQDWSSPPLQPRALREQRYRHFIEVLRFALAHCGVLRIDHVMGLQRLYWIPPGFDARHGAYVSYPAEELHAIVCLEAQRAGSVVVGEDLGTVETSVREAMARDRMLRSWVMQFQTSVEDPLPPPPRHCLASFGTHDTPRFAAYFRGAQAGEPNRIEDLLSDRPPHENERARWRSAVLAAIGRQGSPPAPPSGAGPVSGEADEERAAVAGCLRQLASSGADLVLVDLGDLLGDLEQENRPGTVDDANWRHRFPATLAEIEVDPAVNSLLDMVAFERETTEDKEVIRG